MFIIRYVCEKHNCDLECVETNSDGNPENALFRIRYAESEFKYDVNLAKSAGIIDEDEKVLKPGTWYIFDHSSFACPEQESIPDNYTRDQEDELFCTSAWSVYLEEVTPA